MQLHYALFQLNQASIVLHKISLSALSGSSRARYSVMTLPAVLKRRSEGTERTEHYPAEMSGIWYHFGRNRSRNRIRKNGRISGQPEPEPDIRYIPNSYMCCIQLTTGNCNFAEFTTVFQLTNAALLGLVMINFILVRS